MTAPGSLDDLQLTFARAVHRGMTGLAGWAAARLDAADAADHARLSDVRSLAAGAAWYASRGLAVFPLAPGEKRPLGGGCCWGTHSRGVLQASSDPAAVAHWWAAHPTANVGLATGHVVDVIDVDGPDGWRTWLDMAGWHRWPAVVGSVSTPRPGGVHRFIRATGRPNRVKAWPGVDFRGLGGYVVVPPSWVRTDEYAGRYRWIDPLELAGR